MAVQSGSEFARDLSALPLADSPAIGDAGAAPAAWRLYAAVIAQSSEAVLITDADLTAPGPRILFVNPAFCAMTGYHAQELIGQSPRLLQGPATSRAVLDQLRSTLQRGTPFTGTSTNYRKNGDAYQVEWLITPITDDDGQLRYFASTQRDVTARDHAEQELRISEARFRDLATNSPDFIYIVDVAQRRAVYFNRPTFLGYSMVDMSQPTFMAQTTHPDDTTAVFAHWQDVLSSAPGATLPIEFQLRAKAGHWEWIESYGTVLSLSGVGSPLQVLMTLRIITARKHSEAALRDSEERYRTIAETAMDAILIVDAHSQIVFANQAVAQVFGYQPDELTGEPLERLMPAAMHHTHSTSFARYVTTGERRLASWAAMHLPGRHRDGTTIPLEISIGEVVRDGRRLFIAVMRDISVRRQMEQDLQRSHTLLTAIVEGTTDAVFVKNLTGHYLLINAAGAALLERSPRDVIGLTDADLGDALTAAWTHAHDQRVVQSGLAETYENDQLVGGQRVRLLTTKNPFRDANGAIVGLIGIARDVTGLKQLEAQLAQSQKMESIGRLAGGVAHDFNNLLTAVLGYTDLLLMTAPPDSDTHADLCEIQRAAQRATTLTRQLLTFARRQPIEVRPLDVNALLRDMTKLIRRLIGAHIDLVLLPASAPTLIQADAGRIEQVIVNLAVNARDAMPHGGTLIITVAPVELAPGQFLIDLPIGQYVHIQLTDTGMGMDEQTQHHMFEPFFTTKEPGEGTGLGLAICDGIIRQHHGRIWATSTLGAGTTFHLMLPARADTVAVAPRDVARPAMVGGSERILVVEDEPTVRALAVRVLRQQGYTVLEASNGVEALLVLQGATAVDLLVTDLVMPQMGGLALVESLHPGAGPRRVLFMSGYTEAALPHADTGEVPHFLQKPFTPHTLAHAVRSALDQV